MRTYCVPNLQLDDLSINFQAIRSELYSDCYLMFTFEFIVHDPLHEARLADSGIADDDQLEQMVLSCDCLIRQHLKGLIFEGRYA